MHEAGCSGLLHWDDPEGCDGEGGGREGQDGEHMYTHGWFMWMYGRNHYNIVKYPPIKIKNKYIKMYGRKIMNTLLTTWQVNTRRRKWQPIPVFLPGKCFGQRSLEGSSPRGCKESRTTDWLTLSLSQIQLPLKIHNYSFPGGSVVKNPPANARDMGSIPWSERSPGEGKGNLLQYYLLGNPMDK